MLQTNSWDPIIGYLKKGYGLTIHTHNCSVAKKYRQSKEKWIYVDWDTNTIKLFEVDIKISVANKTGVLAKVHQCYLIKASALRMQAQKQVTLACTGNLSNFVS